MVRQVARDHPVLAACTAAYLAGFSVYGALVGSDVALPYVVLIVAAIWLISALEVRVGLGPVALWGMAAWGLGHLAGGVIPLGDGDRVLYNAVVGIELFHFDRLVHAFGFGIATLVCGIVVRRWLPGGRIGTGPAVVIVLAGLGVGALNEIVEFAATWLARRSRRGGPVSAPGPAPSA